MPTKMRHANSRRQITVADEQVPMYASQGWRVAEATPKARTRKRATTKTTAPTKDAAK